MLALLRTLLFLSAESIRQGAGSRVLDRLGGLIHRMPATSFSLIAGASCLAALPPLAGFAGAWLLLQALLAALRIGGLGLQIYATLVIALLGLAAGIAAAASVRLVGIACLGRPRSPRGAAADEVARPASTALLGLAFCLIAAGLLPGPVLALADPALRDLLGVGWDGRDGLLAMTPQAGLPAYSPLAIAALLALGFALVALGLYRWAVRGERRAPAWDGGFAAPPPWLPFGDPTTQIGAAGFAAPLQRGPDAALLGRRETIDRPAPGEMRPADLVVTRPGPFAAWRRPLGVAAFWTAFWAARRSAALEVPGPRGGLAAQLVLVVLLLGLLAWAAS